MKNELMENYKNLLFAIFNTDEKETISYICVYDTRDNDRLVAIFSSSKSCATFFKTSERSINSSVCGNHLRRKRYRLERVIEREKIDEEE